MYTVYKNNNTLKEDCKDLDCFDSLKGKVGIIHIFYVLKGGWELTENLVFYQSKYGATEQYASWLKEMISCDVMGQNETLPQNLKSYRNIVVAGGIYKGEITGRDFMKRNMEAFKDHRVAVLAVGLEEFYKGLTEALWLYQFKEFEIDVEVFYARGEYDYQNLTFMDRVTIRTGNVIFRRKIKRGSRERINILRDRTTAYDWKEKSYLEPLVDWLDSG